MEDRSNNHREPIRLPDFLNQDVGDSTQPDNKRSGIAWGQIIALVLAAGFSLVVVEALFSPNSLRNDSRVSNHVHTVVSAGHDSIDVPAAALIVFGLPAIALLVRSVFKPTVFQTALTLIAANWIASATGEAIFGNVAAGFFLGLPIAAACIACDHWKFLWRVIVDTSR